MPTFCRHNRFVEKCPICSKAERTRPGTMGDAAGSTAGARRPAPARPERTAAGARRRSPRSAGNLVVRRQARAIEDGYEEDLVPGLRASADAAALAAELAWAWGRLEELASSPSGLYADAAAEPDVEEGLWLAFQLAVLDPVDGSLGSARVTWASGAVPEVGDVQRGPRASGDPAKTFAAYRAWAVRVGSQAAGLAGEPGWTPQRRFDRGYERLSLGGLQREPRYEFLVVAGRLGLVDVEPGGLWLSDSHSPVVGAAKRVFGIGDPLLLARRAAELAAAAGIPIGAFDLALQNWARGGQERLRGGSAQADEPRADLLRPIASVLGVAAGEPEEDPASEPAPARDAGADVDADADAGSDSGSGERDPAA